MKQFRQLILSLVLLFPVMMSAQDVISGKVTDRLTGSELPGVTVLVKGSSTGTATDFDGNFELSVDDPNAVIVFSYVGYNNVEMTASQNMNVLMEESAESLEEVILIGYGQTTKKDATGAVERVSSEEFNPGAIASPEQLITGKSAGVNVVPPSGRPGEGGTIKIRGGVSSLSASNSPLIVIDGVPVDQDGPALNTINPNDIESFNILKDASATAIYGSRASNGVILITTKSGKMHQDFNISLDSKFSWGRAENKVDLLNKEEFINAINGLNVPEAAALLTDDETDWQDQIYQTAFGTDNNLSFSEGFENSSYRISMGYFLQEGILKTSEYNRKTAALNFRQNLFDNSLKMDFNIRGSFAQDEFANEGAIGSSVSMDPTKPVFSGNDNYGGYWEWLNANGSPNNLSPRNPLGLLNQFESHAGTDRFIGNAKFDYSFWFLEGLSIVANFGFDYSEVDGNNQTLASSASGFYNGGTRGVYDSMRRNTLADVYLNYVQTFNDVHRFDIMLGQSFQDFYRENSSFNRDGDGTVRESQYASTNALLGYIARLNYGYDNRYLLTFTYRRDGSSRFAPENRWGNFYSGALAWNITEEAFLQDSETISTLKLRLGYGETGQQEIGSDFGYLPVYLQGQDNVRYPFGDTYINTLRPAGYDAGIKWEETATYNIGLDYGFFMDRVTGSIEYFKSESTDILNTVAPPAGSNLSNSLYTNIGDLDKQGVEFTLNGDVVQSENFTWNLMFNATWLENEIKKLNAVDDPTSPGLATGGISGGVGNTIQTHKVGYPQSSFLVYQQVYDNDGNPIEGVYVDTNEDGAITDADKRIFNSPNPDWLLGLSSYMNYRNFDLNFTMRASLGNYAYNNVASANGNQDNLYDLGTIRNAHSSILDTNFRNPQYWSDYYVQDASFLRMDNITLGYNFSNLKNGDVRLRIYSTVQNVFTITDYDGLDPEINGGIDNNFYPRPQTLLFGFNVNF
ncbi:SusC/RagA family TonB-linked outer membrane protein [Namhaeicola litoreus]|uniref:SusC/RagA family TonB-linked outer membrane protein n=1 Tax=Namhaeicola litoreus TaxID=1052145 RepID=A0ABW3Y1D5_9FLAO